MSTFNEIIEDVRDKFTLQIVSDTGERNLIVHGVQPSDTGTYVCVDSGGIGDRTTIHLNVTSDERLILVTNATDHEEVKSATASSDADAVAVTTSVIASPAADNVQGHPSQKIIIDIIIIAVVCTGAIAVVVVIVIWKLRQPRREVNADELRDLNATNVEQAPVQSPALNGIKVNSNNELSSVTTATVSQIHVDPARVSHYNAGQPDDRQIDPVPPARICHPLSEGDRASRYCIDSADFDSRSLTVCNSATAISPAHAAGVRGSLSHSHISMHTDSLPSNHSLPADNSDGHLNWVTMPLDGLIHWHHRHVHC
jgi:hypothetical protein